jgi:hypothetical protein
MANFKKSWEMEVGLNNVPSYQVSGQPFVTGGIDCSAGPVKITFPSVTRWVMVANNVITLGVDVKVGFSEAGVSGDYYFTVPNRGGAPGLYPTTGPLELKVSELWITGSTDVDVMAGLTSIPPERTATSDGPSWSGSAGVG